MAHFYTGYPRMCAHFRPKSRRNAAVGLRNASLRLSVRDRTPQTPECPGRFASLCSEHGTVSLAPRKRLSPYGKRRDHLRHAFCIFYCLINTPLKAGLFLALCKNTLPFFESVLYLSGELDDHGIPNFSGRTIIGIAGHFSKFRRRGNVCRFLL